MASQAIGIDIGSHAIKVAYLQKKGASTRAVRLFRATISGDEDIVRVAGALQRAGIRGGPGLIGITGRDLIVRYTHVPPVPDWRLKLLMQFEINEVSGQSGGEVAADFRRLVLPVEADEETVLVALARDTWLRPRLNAVTGSGIKADGGCPNSVALFNSFLAHGSYADGETTYLVNIGRGNIDMALQRDGELLFARNMAGGGQMFTESIMSTFGLREPKAEKNKVTKGDLTPKGKAKYPDATSEKLANAMQGPAGQLVSMIQSTVMICRAQTRMSDLNVDRVLLSGGCAQMKGLRDYFAANMSVPVELFDPVAELDLSNDFSTAIGLAETLLQPTSFRLEVLTEKEKTKRRFMQRTVWALASAAAMLLLVVLLFQDRAAQIADVQEANVELEAAASRLTRDVRLQKEAKKAESDARHKDVALRARRLGGALLRNVIVALGKNNPEGMFLHSLEMKCEKTGLDLAGRPAKTSGTSEDEGKAAFHSQFVWPQMTVIAEVQRDQIEGRLGDAVNRYQSAVKETTAEFDIDGWKVEFVPESLQGKRFKMSFGLKAETDTGKGN
jgi:type IV pilus assembly protein PilM